MPQPLPAPDSGQEQNVEIGIPALDTGQEKMEMGDDDDDDDDDETPSPDRRASTAARAGLGPKN